MKQHIVGLTGYVGCGKDTVAAILAECGGFARLAFADALKQEICDAFSIAPEYLNRRELKEVATPLLSLDRCLQFGFVGAAVIAFNRGDERVSRGWLMEPRTPRQIMQLWGTEYRRKQNPAYWTRIVSEKVRIQRANGQRHFVITDVRYPNEAETVKLMGGSIWQVVRPGAGAVNSHSSEVAGAEFEPARVIRNDGDLRQLRSTVLAAYWNLDTGLDVSELTGAAAQ
jgi:hypothetical protein